MPKTLMEWFVPDRIIYAQDRTQELDEMTAAVDLAVQMMEQSSAATVHHLIDQRYQPTAAENIDLNLASRNLRRFLTHPKTGWVLTCYGSSMFLQYANWVLAHENQVLSRHFDSAREALDFLMSVDDSLGNMPDVEAFMQDFDQRHR